MKLIERREEIELDRVGSFWVVTFPNESSTLDDILFESDIAGMRLQFLGGLTIPEIALVTHNESEAKKFAIGLLEEN